MIRYFLLFFIGILFCSNITAQELSGYVRNETNKPIEGVSVYVKGRTTGTVTSNSGYFRLNIREVDSIIIFQHIAYKRLERKFGYSKSTQTFDIKMAY